MTGLHQACDAAEVPAGGARAVEVAGVRLAIVHAHDGSFHALSGRCPHSSGPLGFGRVEDGTLVCPLHRWRFRLADGRCETVRGEWVVVYPCEVRAGVVWVTL